MGRRANEGFRVQWKRGWAYVRFTHEGIDHRVALGTRDPGEAQASAAQEYARALSGRRRPVVAARGRARPLDVLLAEWIGSCAGVLDEDTCSTLEIYARHYCAAFEGLHDITRESAKDFTRARLRQVLRRTVLKELSFLRGFLAWCVDTGEIDEAPVIDPPPGKATGVRAGPQRSAPVAITEEQALAIIAALPEASKTIGGRRWPVRARFLVAWETGLRPASLAALRVPQSYRKGASELLLEDAEDKARFGRTLPLSPEARRALDAAVPERGLIFGDHNFAKALKLAARGVLGTELGDRFAPYDFRHGRGTHLVGQGAPLTGVAYLLGHRRLSTTDRYLRPSRRDAERALAAVGAPFPPPGSNETLSASGKPSETLGDRRGLNPRHLEPQGSRNDENAEDLPGSVGLVEPRKATPGQDTRPGGGFLARAQAALEEAFAEQLAEALAWEQALAGAAEGDEDGVLEFLRAAAARGSWA